MLQRGQLGIQLVNPLLQQLNLALGEGGALQLLLIAAGGGRGHDRAHIEQPGLDLCVCACVRHRPGMGERG